MKNLWIVAGLLCRWQITGDLWIDGSFLTEKIDPKDVDFLILLPIGFADTATLEQAAILEWLCEDKTQPAKVAFQCDSYSLYKSDGSDGGLDPYLKLFAYWKKHFGFSRQAQPKGIALISVPGACA